MDIKKLISIVSESGTSAGSVASVSAPITVTQTRIEENTPNAPQVIEYGNWENSALTTSSQLKKSRKKASKVVKSIYGEDSVGEVANSKQQAAIAVAKKKEVGEGKSKKQSTVMEYARTITRPDYRNNEKYKKYIDLRKEVQNLQMNGLAPKSYIMDLRGKLQTQKDELEKELGIKLGEDEVTEDSDNQGVAEAAKWRQGYRASGHPSGFKHKSGEVGPLGGTWDEVMHYDEPKKVPVQRHRDEIDPLSMRDIAGTSTTGKPLLAKNKQRNLKNMIKGAKHLGPVGHLPEGVAEGNDKNVNVDNLRTKTVAGGQGRFNVVGIDGKHLGVIIQNKAQNYWAATSNAGDKYQEKEGFTGIVDAANWIRATHNLPSFLELQKMRRSQETRPDSLSTEQGVAEGSDVTDYNPKSQGGTRKELLAKYHKTKDPKDAEAARRAGATQKELQGVAEGDKLQGTPVVSLSDFDDKDNKKIKYGQTVPKKLEKDDPRVKFHKEPEKQGVAEGHEETEETAVINMFEKLVKQGRDPIDMISHKFGWGSYELDQLAQNLGFKNSAGWAHAVKQGKGVNEGVAEGTGDKVHLKTPKHGLADHPGRNTGVGLRTFSQTPEQDRCPKCNSLFKNHYKQDVAEATGDATFDKMMRNITKKSVVKALGREEKIHELIRKYYWHKRRADLGQRVTHEYGHERQAEKMLMALKKLNIDLNNIDPAKLKAIKSEVYEQGVAEGSLASRYSDDPTHPSFGTGYTAQKDPADSLAGILALRKSDPARAFRALQDYGFRNPKDPIIDAASKAGSAVKRQMLQKMGITDPRPGETPKEVIQAMHSAMFDYIEKNLPTQQGVGEGLLGTALDKAKSVGKKVLDVVAPDDEELLRQLQRSMGIPASSQHGKKSMAEPVDGKLDEADLIINPASMSKRPIGLLNKPKHPDHEVGMAKSDLYQASKNALAVFQMIRDVPEEVGIEGWVQEKIIKANDYLNTVREYLEGKQLESMDGVAPSTKMFTSEDSVEEGKTGPGLWANIRKRRASGKRMRKPGEKGAPSDEALKSAREGSTNEAKGSRDLVDITGALGDLERAFNDLLRTHDPEERKKHQAAVKQRLKTEPVAGPKGVLPENGIVESAYPEISDDEIKQLLYKHTGGGSVLDGKSLTKAVIGDIFSKLAKGDQNKLVNMHTDYRNVDAFSKRIFDIYLTIKSELGKNTFKRVGEQEIVEGTCPSCSGPAFSDEVIAEAKDACYHKVKSRYKVWPSAYASGALVKCRKVGAKNWGKSSK